MSCFFSVARELSAPALSYAARSAADHVPHPGLQLTSLPSRARITIGPPRLVSQPAGRQRRPGEPASALAAGAPQPRRSEDALLPPRRYAGARADVLRSWAVVRRPLLCTAGSAGARNEPQLVDGLGGQCT